MCVLSLEWKLVLIFRFKEEPASVTAPATRHNITDTYAAASNSQNSVVSAGATVSDTLEGPKDRRDQVRMVSTIHILSVAE